MTHLSALWRDPAMRLVALGMLFLGVLNASIYPYQSLVGIKVVGLSEPRFAIVLVLASVTAVSASVLFGVLADRRAARRGIALASASVAVLAALLMLAAPGPVALILAHGLLFPVASSLYGQFFALARLARSEAGATREATLGAVRAFMSASFLALLIFWTFAFKAGAGVMWVYVPALMAALALWLLIRREWPKDGATLWLDQPSGLNFRGAMAEITRPRVLTRLLLLGGIASAANLYMIVTALVFTTTPGRGTGDVALYVGMVAGWEVPFMLLLPRVAHRISRRALLVWGTVIYVCHLALLPLLAGTSAVWLLTLLAGLGGTAIITLPIGYYQDLLPDRPGTAGALLAVQKLVSDVFAACAFAIGTALGGVEVAALTGTALALIGAIGLWWADRQRGEAAA